MFLFVIALVAAASHPAAGAEGHPSLASVRARASGERIAADLQQNACGLDGRQSFSSLTRAAPATDWTTATSDGRYSWYCRRALLLPRSVLSCAQHNSLLYQSIQFPVVTITI